MTHTFPSVAAVLLAMGVAVAPSAVSAQCAFEHPRKASKVHVSLVSAFTGCGGLYYGNSPNTTTEGNVPACKPPETYDQQAGSPSNGWRWNELEGMGQVQLKASSKFPPSALNPPSNSADILIRLKMSGVDTQSFGPPASGNGNLALIMRMTFDDRASGDGTVVDFPLNAPFAMTDGKANVKTSVDSVLNSDPQPGLPRCSNVEVLSIAIIDPNGNTFANEGLYLP